MKTIPTKQITITDPYIRNAQERLVDYLLSLKANKFLFEVYRVAGLPPLTDSGYQGWERSDAVNFRGHFFGHFMSALALAYDAEKDPQKKQRLFKEMQVAVTGLATAQGAYGEKYPQSRGYISAFRESALDEVEGKTVAASEKENVLVPWYNLHKLLAGLLGIYTTLKTVDGELSSQALEVAANFGDYVYRRMQQLPDKKRMLQIEYGGMNDGLYQLFEITGKKEHLLAATYFDEEELFWQLAAGQDVLAGKHANTQIPKLIGAIKRYRVLQTPAAQALLTDKEKEELNKYKKAASQFWDIVVDAHTYCTGGNSQSEHFHEPHQLYADAELRNGDCTCETCNSHNMLKLTRHLYAVDPDPKYLDYYERTYINGILASQDPETGMMMYFQPMGAGYNKVYNRPYDDFWCCTGTGIESFAKLADTYYLKSANRLLVNLYFSNHLDTEEISLQQDTDRSKMKSSFKVLANPGKVMLGFRVPNWQKGILITVNGKSQTPEIENGFVILSTPVKKDDLIEVTFQPELRLVHTDDHPNYVAFEYGPYVLAGGLGHKDLHLDHPNGILVRVGTKDPLLPDTLTYTAADWRAIFETYLEPVSIADKVVAFKINGIEEEVILSPYYQMHHERYGIYFKLIAAGSTEALEVKREKALLAAQREKILDRLSNFDDNNSEYAKELTQEHSQVGAFAGRRYRQALENGWFSYYFNIAAEGPKKLFLTFHQADCGKRFALKINDEETTVTVEECGQGEFLTQEIPLLQKALTARTKVTIRSIDAVTPRIFGITFEKI